MATAAALGLRRVETGESSSGGDCVGHDAVAGRRNAGLGNSLLYGVVYTYL
jgi:hypothetical protein